MRQFNRAFAALLFVSIMGVSPAFAGESTLHVSGWGDRFVDAAVARVVRHVVLDFCKNHRRQKRIDVGAQLALQAGTFNVRHV